MYQVSSRISLPAYRFDTIVHWILLLDLF